MLVDFKELPDNGEDWEAFARDFLVMLGFAIDVPPNRGADGGKDLIVVEQLRGKLSSYSFRWLVSCKHHAHSGKAVSETHEPNILERVSSHACDGFIGVYSTVPASGLTNRLHGLKAAGKVRDYRIFDSRLIENHLVRVGYSQLLLRYLPKAYAVLKPAHALTGEYLPLECAVCHKDLLEPKGIEGYAGLVGIATVPDASGQHRRIVDVYWACKNPCNLHVEAKLRGTEVAVGWEDISDLAIPAWYLRWMLALMNRLRNGDDVYDDEAYEHIKDFTMAVGQKVFREITEQERERVRGLFDIPML